MKKKLCLSIIVIVVIAFFNVSYSIEKKDKKVIMFLTTYMNLEDFNNMNVTRKLMSSGNSAVMNIRASGSYSILKSYLTLGTGTRSEANQSSFDFQELNEKNKKTYYLKTGYRLDKNSGIININNPSLINTNTNGDFGATVGALGHQLHMNNKKTAIIGNLDTDEKLRIGPSITMDEKGFTDYALIDEKILIEDASYPYGIRQNYNVMKREFERVYNNADFIVIEIGDFYRLENYKKLMTYEAYNREKNKTLKNISEFMNECLSKSDLSKDEIIVLNPYPSTDDMKSGNRLMPIIIKSPQKTEGTVYSHTTKRLGIIANIDIPVYILNCFEIDTNNMSGRKIVLTDKESSYDYISKLYSDTMKVSKNRYPVLSTFAIFEIIISLIGLVFVLMKNKLKDKTIRYFSNVLLVTMTIPFVLLIVSLIGIYDTYTTFALVSILTIIITCAIKYISKKSIDSILIIGSITTIGLFFDICFGAELIKKSILGYDPIIGARYYGIGNEYMGILIGASIVAITSLIDRIGVNKLVGIILSMILIIVMGFPKLGANVGGTITAICAFIFLFLRLYNVKVGLKHIIAISAIVIAVIGIFAYVDINLFNGGSHLGRAVLKIIKIGPSEVVRIINRKIQMNLRLIGITIWSKVLIISIVLIGIIFYKPSAYVSVLSTKYPNLIKGFTAIVCACAVTFFVNDSGIVAAGTGIIFLVMSMLYLILATDK